MKYIIANLKEHQSLTDANTWINSFVNIMRGDTHIKEALNTRRLEVIIAPSAPFLLLYKTAIHEFEGITLAAQDISVYEKGSYTGEVGSRALAGIVQYALVGHSERRSHFNETNQTVTKKITAMASASIRPIVCIRSPEDMIGIEHGMIAYEPADAIGGGHNYPVETVLEFKSKLELKEGAVYIYGGSVDEQNERLYLKSDEINGLLVGTVSLDASRFCEMLRLV